MKKLAGCETSTGYEAGALRGLLAAATQRCQFEHSTRYHDTDDLQLPVLEQLKDKIENRLDAFEKHGLAQHKVITQLQQEREQALACKAKRQQEILLGQIAYTTSKILEEFVFGADGSSSLLPQSRLCKQNYAAHRPAASTVDCCTGISYS